MRTFFPEQGVAASAPAVQEFLARELDDSSSLRDASNEYLDAALAALNPPPVFHTKPFRHQKAAFLLAQPHAGYVLLLDMGTGKSKVALDLFRYRLQTGQARRCLVLVPNVSNIGSWLEQVKNHAPELSRVGILGSDGDARRYAMASSAKVVICTYAGLQAIVCSVKQKGRVIDEAAFAHYLGNFQMVVYDESTALKNHTTINFKIARRLVETVPFRLCMTGTPGDKTPEDFWSQFFAADGGETLGRNLGLYRAAFFEAKRDPFKGIVWRFRPSRRELLARTLLHRSVRYAESECLDLPESCRNVVPVTLSDAQRAKYDLLKKKIKKYEEERDTDKVINTYIAARRIVSGWQREGDATDGAVKYFPQNPKLAALIETIEELPEEEKAIVFFTFKVTGTLLEAALAKAKLPAVRLSGDTKDKNGVIERFKRDSRIRVLCASKSGAFGLNLQVANHVMFYEQPDSSIERQQAERRVRRPGQTRRTFIWDFVATETVDEKIIASVQEGRDLIADLIDGNASL